METHSVLEPGTVLPPGRLVPAGQLWGGNPAKFMRELTKDEVSALCWVRIACMLTGLPTSSNLQALWAGQHLLEYLAACSAICWYLSLATCFRQHPEDLSTVWPFTAFGCAVADS